MGGGWGGWEVDGGEREEDGGEGEEEGGEREEDGGEREEDGDGEREEDGGEGGSGWGEKEGVRRGWKRRKIGKFFWNKVHRALLIFCIKLFSFLKNKILKFNF